MRNGRRNIRSKAAGRHLALLGFTAALVLLTLLAPPVDQPADYNDWADRRTLLGIPHFGDVVSNLAFLWVGAAGLLALGSGRCRCDLYGESRVWALVFVGLCLTAAGSAWYHWQPDNDRLLWDRLAMALTFMALLSALLLERTGPRIALTSLPLLVVFGWLSVAYWYWTVLQGDGDLRFYLLAQGGTALLIPLLLWWYPATYDRGGDYLVALGLYGLALGCEWLDVVIFELTGMVSGHTLKHLMAALAGYWLLRMLELRRALPRR